MSTVLELSMARAANANLAARAARQGFTLKFLQTNSRAADRSSESKPGDVQSPVSALLPDFILDILLRSRQPTAGATARQLYFDSLYDQLYQAYLARDAQSIVTIATYFLNAHPISRLSDLPEIVRRAHQFFTTRGCDAEAAELLAFYRSFSEQDINEFLSTSAEFLDELACQILCAQVLGILGQQLYNMMDLYKSVIMLLYLHDVAHDFNEDLPTVSSFPAGIFCFIWELQIFLPEWGFDIDPCAWNSGDPRTVDSSPLANKMSKIKAYNNKIVKKRNAAEPPGEEPDCDCSDKLASPCLPPAPCCADINYYVSDLLVLRDELHCYKAADLAYIENVAAGEARIRRHGFKKTTEDFSEEEITKNTSEVRDHQVTERFELQREIEKQFSASMDVEASYNAAAYKIKSSTSLSADAAKREARETFRESVDKAVSKIQVESRNLVSRRVTTETTEDNKHKFKNDEIFPLVTKYFWVTQVKKAQVFSHGLRGTVELLIPSPALLYEHLQKIKAEAGFSLERPPDLILTASEITQTNYLSIATGHGVPNPPTPPELTEPNISVSQGYNKTIRNKVKIFPEKNINIPSGQVATSMMISGGIDWRGSGDPRRVRAQLATKYAELNADEAANAKVTFSGLTGNQVVVFDANNTKSFLVHVTIELALSGAVLTEWQSAVLAAITEKHDADVAAYEEALAEHNRAAAEKFQTARHPFAAQEIMLTEIKRAAIYMMCEDFEREGVMNLKSEPCGYPEINRPEAGKKTWDWYFWDRAIDWELMSFKFYDYFWNPVCLWPDKFDPGDDNYMFNAFLRAGYARLQIPIAKGMEEDFVWYLETGTKWGAGGNPPTNPSDSRWLNVIEEIKHSRNCYQNDREGDLDAPDLISNPTLKPNVVFIKGSDRYWDPWILVNNVVEPGAVDQIAISLDKDREIYIDGTPYRIIDIEIDPNSPPFDDSTRDAMWWKVTLERPFEGDRDRTYKYAVGAEFIGAPFFFDLPTNLIWAGDHHNMCLPCYPLPDCLRDTAGEGEEPDDTDPEADQLVVGSNVATDVGSAGTVARSSTRKRSKASASQQQGDRK